MRKWTMVIEFTDNLSGSGANWDKPSLEEFISTCLSGHLPPKDSFRIMETIEAPYGPQHRNGVFITEVKTPAILHHGLNADCPEVQSGKWTYCHGHEKMQP